MLGAAIGYWTRTASRKFMKGREEHGDDLGEKSELELVDEAINENIDQYFYLFALRRKLTE